MDQKPPFRKIFEFTATHAQMFELLARVPEAPAKDIASGKAYTNQWFEISEVAFETMLERLPLLFHRRGNFAMAAFKAGCVASVFFQTVICGKRRWFHGYCDLVDRESPDAMRAAILAHERALIEHMTREQKLDLVWSRWPAGFRALVGESNAAAWPPELIGTRTVMRFEPGVGLVQRPFDILTDDEIADALAQEATF